MSSTGPGSPGGDAPADGHAEPGPCDCCGAERLVWRKCKLVCGNCDQINKTCADL